MAVTYTCPNPSCGAALKTPNPVPAGRRVKCPKCEEPFIPVPAEDEAPPKADAGPGTFKFADDPADKKKPSAAAFNFASDPKKKGAVKKDDEAKPAPPPPPPPPPPPKPADDDDDDPESIKRGYGVAVEADEERMKA